MNPFSGFMQPTYQGLDLSPVNQALSQIDRRQESARDFAQHKLENEQHNNTSQAYLKLQQDQVARKVSKEDQAEVEGLLAEYQDAVAKGDPAGISNSIQKLKRFGMDVQGASPQLLGSALPNVQAFTGQSKPTPGMLQAFTGASAFQSPIDQAVETELATRAKLRQKAEQPEQDLPQSDFEEQLINSAQGAPSRYESSGQTTDEYKAMLPQSPEAPEGTDLGDVDSPEFRAAAAQETTNLGDVDAPEFQAAAAREAGPQSPDAQRLPPPQLATQALPNISISKSGKQLYSGAGQQGRWTPMVTGVFEPFVGHENPEIAAAAKRAQELAGKLIQVDGIAPKDAIEFAMKRLENEASRATQLERTNIGSQRRGSGGVGGGTGLLGKTQDIAESIQAYDDNARQEAAKIQEEDRQYEDIEAKISSGDPALQRDAVNTLLKVRSGTAVTASEDARISQINGLVAQVEDRLSRWTGGAMTPEMVSTIRRIAQIKREVSQAKIQRIYQRQAKLYRAQNEGKTKDPNVLDRRAKALESIGVGGKSEEDLY